MIDFVKFLLSRVYNSKSIPDQIIISAFEKTVKDVQYHFSELSFSEIESKIKSNSNELAVFLFRLGNELHLNNLEELKPQIHWLLKELCSCEIYFNNAIDIGFYVVHGEGTVIGSRNIIGKGFIIHHGCTIGHKKNGNGNGNTIGDDVKMYSNSSIIGELSIGNKSIIGANVTVTKDIQPNIIVTTNLYQTEKKIT
jgi:serine O-acetyltransferase